MDKAEYSNGKDYFVQIIPLMRFMTESDITLEGCKIRGLNKIEKQKICNSTALELAWGALRLSFGRVNFVIESSLSDSRLAHDVISALRVFKSNAVSDLPYITLHVRNREIVHIGSCQFWMRLYEITDGAAYTLSEEEAKEFERFWKFFSETMSFPYMRIAVNRFSYAYRKGFGGDMLVDYIIALEALFSESPETISYKLRLRVPMFLGIDTSINQRKRIRNYVAAAYNIRSKIVHGSKAYEKLIREEMKKLDDKLGSDKVNFVTQFLPEIREITRKAIYRFVSHTQRGLNKISILQTIDDALLTKDAEKLS